MQKTNTIKHQIAHLDDELLHFTNATFELVKWPFNSSHSLDDKVIAIQTTRLSPQKNSILKNNEKVYDLSTGEESPFNSFNLGLHVSDIPNNVVKNRDKLKRFISQKIFSKEIQLAKNTTQDVQVQWLEQVHGSEVVTVSAVQQQPIIADASITRQKKVALAIMTADCLPILLRHKDGIEIAAIHGGWRPLSKKIIAKTLNEMHSKPSDIIAWLGPCIGRSSFEVGGDVKQIFTQLDSKFDQAFLKKDAIHQGEVKYLADLHKIARLQLTSLGINEISNLEECTYENTHKYYSYRKDNITGRMASIICRY